MTVDNKKFGKNILKITHRMDTGQFHYYVLLSVDPCS